MLSANEKKVLSALSYQAGLAGAIFDSWADLPETSPQTERSLIDLAQFGLTEERAVRELLVRAVELGLLTRISSGYLPCAGAHKNFKRLAFALQVIDHYVASVHKDATYARIVLTKPSNPSVLEQKLSELGWRISDLEPTNQAFLNMVSTARDRVVIMTPFFDEKGALWLQELLSAVQHGVQSLLILRSLEDSSKSDYPSGYNLILPLIQNKKVTVYNYSIPRIAAYGRETFHAKVVLCDEKLAYIGSSNLTKASLEHSMEVGVALEGRAVVDVVTVLKAVLNAATLWTPCSGVSADYL